MGWVPGHNEDTAMYQMVRCVGEGTDNTCDIPHCIGRKGASAHKYTHHQRNTVVY